MARHDVIVVGAGLAGLATARRLRDQGLGVLVLEARDRVGGRTWTRDVHGARMDVGGQWLDATQHRMLSLCDEFGLATFPTHTTGRQVLLHRGRRSEYAGTIPKLSPHVLLQLQAVLTAADRRLAGRVDPEAPHDSPAAERLDAISLAHWLRRFAPSRQAREVLDVAVHTIFGADASEVPALWAAAYARAGGGLLRLAEVEGGAQETRFVDGAQAVSTCLADDLGDAVRTGAPVLAIDQSGDGVQVHHGHGTNLAVDRADRVVIALAPSLAARLRFTPELPHTRTQLHTRWPMGATTKILTVHERPFWRDQGLSGEVVATREAAAVTFDNTSHDGEVAALVTFVVGPAARTWSQRTQADRRREVLDVLTQAFGPEAGRPIDWIEQDWTTEPWSGGCPVGNPGQGTLTQFPDAIRTPVGRLHWAGTETATEWTGYMEGALQSAERVSAEVLTAMNGSGRP